MAALKIPTIPAIRVHHTMSKEAAKLCMAFLSKHPTPDLADLGKAIADEYRRCFCHYCSEVAVQTLGVGDMRGICGACAAETPKCRDCSHFATLELEDGRCRLCWTRYRSH